VKFKVTSMLCTGLLAVALLVSGCIIDSAQKVNNDDTELQVPDLEAEFGGFKPTDEAAGFGDPEMESEFGEDQDVIDLLNTDPRLAADLEDSLVDVYFLRIVWGRLEWDTSAVAITDWSGSLQIDKGTLVLLRKIRFEPEDYIHRPRPDRRTLEWTSYTGPHFDGIHIAIVVAPRDTNSAEGNLTFTTAPFSQTFSFTELDSIDVIYPVDQQGNEIAFVGHKRQLVPCGNGFLEGRWMRTERHQGAFKGRWINRNGTLVGHFQGRWGKRNNGQQMMFGKCIGPDGQFKWLLRARWEYSHSRGENGGWFAGALFDRDGQARGVLKGRFRAGGANGKKGYFQGQWRLLCP
jgi:hypothetical protein